MSRYLLSLSFLCILLSTAGCRPEITCEDLGCSFGQTCNPTSGQCEAIVFDCRDQQAMCPAGEVCDTTSGECRSEALRCADGNPCPDDLICDATSGFCRPVFRCSLEGCPPSETCDQRTDRCVPRPCGLDAECPEQFICIDSACTDGCRPGQDSCPSGEACYFQTGNEFGECRAQCENDVECPFGQFCAADADGNACLLEPSCDDDGDCRPDEVCKASQCSQPPCSTDQDCLDDQLCDTATGTCLNNACDEDIYGAQGGDIPANHQIEYAFPLAPGDDCRAADNPRCSYEELKICPGRSDWFALDVESSTVVSIRLEQLSEAPDLDLYVWDEDQALLAQDQLVAPVSSVRFAAPRDQVVFVEIRATTFEAASYNLAVSTEFCADDAFEENDTAATATSLSAPLDSPAQFDAQLCGSDTDWFTIPVTEARHAMSVEWLTSPPDGELTLFTPDGESFSVPSAEPLRLLRTGAIGDYLLRARSSQGLGGAHQIRYAVESAWECPSAGTYASHENARTFDQDELASLLCPDSTGWEVDWFVLPAGLDGLTSVEVVRNGAPELDVSLMEANDDAPLLLRGASQVGELLRLSAVLTPETTYYLRVSSDAALGRIAGEPSYRVSLSLP